MGLKNHENSSQLHVLLFWLVSISGDEVLLLISAQAEKKEEKKEENSAVLQFLY